uniref:Uncharacterized protein n=1 Tax=Bionectria ochroleuca TaxID=29856 RepID=A0A0B7KJD8_BIOOC
MSSPNMQQGPEPVAIIGMGCRMPGGAHNPHDLWQLLMSRVIANTDRVPSSRFNIDAYLHQSLERPGSFNVSGGYFLDDDLQGFEPKVFSLSPVEALWMDPQQKKLLEVVYEAFESSGTRLRDVAGKKTGCYIGNFTQDFQHMAGKEPDFNHKVVANGVDPGMVANRLSYVFDLKGPSMMLNTACSSSLYALDLACKAIAAGQCDSAIVGGTNLIIAPDQQMNTARMGVMSRTNQSHTFDVTADGYGRAEGVGALYIKPLSAALQNGDPIRAIIRSTASNFNGKGTEGITHPSVDGQFRVMRAAYEMAGLDPKDTFYVECHGTGTPVGDPIEVKAVHRAMGTTRSSDNPVMVGSVKPNIGHSESASSMGTLIKAVLSLENGVIPPTAGITKLNPSIPWDDVNVRVVMEPTPFPTSMPYRRIGVSAFGYGGTNSHAILESYDDAAHSFGRRLNLTQSVPALNDNGTNGVTIDRPHLLLFSAHDEVTLKHILTNHSTSCNDAKMVDLAYTLAARRTKHSKRAFAIARKHTLEADIAGADANITSEPRAPATPAFVFTGQGSQWATMGASLIDDFPSFRQSIQKLDQHLATLCHPPSWKIESVLTEPEETSLINEAEFSQPICTALQIALVDLLARWGIKPAATVGHSSGEMGAAYAAGRISAQDAITAAYYRGIAAASLKTNGAMLAVGLGAEESQKYIDESPAKGTVVVACHNSPGSSTLSGDRSGIESLKAILDENKVFARVLKTGGKAYHSHFMKDGAEAYADYLKKETNITTTPFQKKPWFSSLKAKAIREEEGPVPDSYWVDNLNNPVLFNQAVKLMLESMPEVNTLVEVGPHSSLEGPLRQICQAAKKKDVTYFSTLKRKENSTDQMFRLAGRLWAYDGDMDLSAVTGLEKVSEQGEIFTERGTLLVDLPSYHWTYSKKYFAESRISKEHRSMKEPRHDILGRRVPGTSALEPMWRNILRQGDLPWLVQHKVAGEVLMPGAGYLALAIEAMTQVNDQAEEPLVVESFTIRNLAIATATVVPDDDTGTETIFVMRPLTRKLDVSTDHKTGQWYEFALSCYSYGTWKEAVRGKIAINVKGPAAIQPPQPLPETPDKMEYLNWLNKLRALGIELGPVFHHISNIYSDGKSHAARGDMRIAKECGLMEGESRYALHPTVLDSIVQPATFVAHNGIIDDLRTGTIPTHFGEVTVYPPTDDQLTKEGALKVWATNVGNRAFSCSCQLIAHDGSLIAEFSDCDSLLYSAAVPPEYQGYLQKDLYQKIDYKIDADYLRWADEAGALSSDTLVTVLNALIFKDPTKRVLGFDESLIPQLLRTESLLKISVAARSRETVESINRQYSYSDAIDVIQFDLNSSDPSTLTTKYDLAVFSASEVPERQILDRIRGVLADKGQLLLDVSGSSDLEKCQEALKSSGFSGSELSLSGSTILTRVVELPNGHTSGDANGHANGVSTPSKPTVSIIYKNEPAAIVSKVFDELSSQGWETRLVKLDPYEPVEAERVVMLADAEGSLLATLEEAQLEILKQITESAQSIVWVTCGGLLAGDKPEFGMAEGFARVIRAEKTFLDFVTVDYDAKQTSDARVASFVADVLGRQQDLGKNGENEYCLRGGAVYVGRLVADRRLNRQFAPDSGEAVTLYQRDGPSVRASISEGVISYRGDPGEKIVGADEVKVHVEAIGLSAEDGSDGRTFLNHELAGTVISVGENVTGIEPGSKVIGFAVDNLSTYQVTPSNLVRPLTTSTSIVEAATIPSAFSAVIYGLEELAKVEEGETVAIVDGMGAVGLAALQWCKLLGVEVVVIATSDSTEALLLEQGMVPKERIVSAVGGGLSARLKAATGGKGIDVLLCSATSDEAMITECGRNLAHSARVVSCGATDEQSEALAGLPVIKMRLSVFHFDLVDLIRHRPRVVARTLQKCVDAFQKRDIKALTPISIIKPPKIEHFIQSGPQELSTGKRVLSYDEDASFNALPSIMPLKFREDATYLLVGCLGGLGVHVALWMAQRGAKHLAFVSRGGTAKEEAAQTVQTLINMGVDVKVLRANINNKKELSDALEQIDENFPIRGVLNAATVLRDGLFRNMSFDDWQAVASTKMVGTLNLHEIFSKPGQLDFFVVTSSVTATLGSSGQANYGAANRFLDHLCHHRQARGLPGVSLILPAIFGIGYLLAFPEIAKSIRSKGMYGIWKQEMLEAFEVAMTPHDLISDVYHIVVGVQPRRYGPAIKAASGDISLEGEMRLSWTLQAIKGQTGDTGSTQTEGATSGVSPLVAIQRAATIEEAAETVTDILARRLARLMMMELESIHTTGKSVASHGLDSMIGAEFRNWIFREFKVDVPFQQLLAGSLTVSELARTLSERVKESHK